MQELETTFEGRGEVRGTHFQQIRKSDLAFLYELTDIETGQIRYEVFTKIESKGGSGILGGVMINFAEKVLYPTSKQFGVTAWCIIDFPRAIKKFNELSGIQHSIKRNNKMSLQNH